MKCPYCGGTETKVVDKRETGEFDSTRRRRECLKCSKRFTTYERVEISEGVSKIRKRDGKIVNFDPEKINEVFNEKERLPPFMLSLVTQMQKISLKGEIIIVDDGGSNDDYLSYLKLTKITGPAPRLRMCLPLGIIGKNIGKTFF